MAYPKRRFDTALERWQLPAMSGPHWSWTQPTPRAIEDFREAQRQTSFTYAEQGLTHHLSAPLGYKVDHNRCCLGQGDAAYEAGCRALRRWTMFPKPWTAITPDEAPITAGQVVTMTAHAFGWWINACRIVYVIDEAHPIRRYGFAYGTLEGHVEQGEERFVVAQHHDGSVWYDLFAFSRPRHWAVRLGKPLARRLQRQFARESMVSMQAAVAREAVEGIEGEVR